MTEQLVIEILEWAVLRLMSEYKHDFRSVDTLTTRIQDDIALLGYTELLDTKTFKNIEMIIQRGLDND